MSGSGGPGSRIPFLLWVQLISHAFSRLLTPQHRGETVSRAHPAASRVQRHRGRS